MGMIGLNLRVCRAGYMIARRGCREMGLDRIEGMTASPFSSVMAGAGTCFFVYPNS